jgi:DNA-binding NarL/FixJ family response regulator
VLIVDDNPSFRAIAAELLRAQGFEVSGCAADAKEAVDGIRGGSPDGVLLDVNLVDVDGLELAARLVAEDGQRGILLTSSDPHAASDELALRCGAAGFLPKTALAQSDLRRYFRTPVGPQSSKVRMP